VHGTDAATGRIGEAKKRNWSNSSGRSAQVPTCIGFRGFSKPLRLIFMRSFSSVTPPPTQRSSNREQKFQLHERITLIKEGDETETIDLNICVLFPSLILRWDNEGHWTIFALEINPN
jgi:hypothetical protein